MIYSSQSDYIFVLIEDFVIHSLSCLPEAFSNDQPNVNQSKVKFYKFKNIYLYV